MLKKPDVFLSDALIDMLKVLLWTSIDGSCSAVAVGAAASSASPPVFCFFSGGSSIGSATAESPPS
eukprot:3009365-Pyramimonas_sp.AAC.1